VSKGVSETIRVRFKVLLGVSNGEVPTRGGVHEIVKDSPDPLIERKDQEHTSETTTYRNEIVAAKW
jgi:hypothetical protein